MSFFKTHRLNHRIKQLGLTAALVMSAQPAWTQVYFEAECGIIGNTLRTGIDSNASETVYVDSPIERTGDLSNVQQDAEDIIQYEVVVPTAGTYDIYVRGLDVSGGDSLYYSLDNLIWTTFNNLAAGPDYEWNDLEGVSVSGGAYAEVVTTNPNETVTIYISRREDEYRIDKFALLPNDSPVPTGLGDSVGSCFDFGDAPDTALNTNGSGDYTSLIGNTIPGPFHLVDQSPSVYLGDTEPDTENDALQNASAAGDDASDEGEVQLISTADSNAFPTITVTDTSVSFEIDVTNSKAVNATLMAWIDFDQDGLFEESERADTNPTITASAGNTQATLTWTTPALSTGNTVARFRLSTDTTFVSADDGGEDALSLGLFLDGEVEDHQITVAPDPGVCSYAAAEAVWNLDGVTTDSSGNAHNQQGDTSLSSGYNSLSYASGGQSLIFNGTSDLLHYSTASAFLEQVFTDMSVFMWILPDNPANTQMIWDEGGGTNGTAITLEGGNLVGSIREGTTSEVNASFPYPTDGRWHHVGISWSGSDEVLRLYLDGVQVDTVAATFGVSLSQHTSNSGIGGSNAGDAAGVTTSYAGLIDEVIYYYSDQSGNVADIANCVTPVLASDYGDALDSYGDASHEVVSSPTLYIGAVTPDTEADTLLGGDAGVGADGDDGDGTDDEEANPVLTGLSSVSTGTFNVSVPVVNTGATATLAGWIDFDDDGIFQADEGALAAANASGSVNLAFDVDAVDINVGTTYARFRITRESITTADANGGFSDGEVEDYELEIVDQDYGDAPITYGEASHTVEPTLRLGSLNDIDPGTQLGGDAGAGADGDDGDGTDDEDSATLSTLSSSATDYSLTVSVTNTGSTATLYGWIDLDLDNTFDEDERTSVSVPNGTSSVDLDWSSITSSSGTSYLRLRLTRDNLTSGENPDGSSQDDVSIGSANDGEVEDYEIQIQPPICYAAYSDASITATALNLEALTPVATGRQSTFSDITTNNNDADDDNYGMIFTTELVLDSPGNFDFSTNSDDGSLLYIDGQLIVNNDDVQGPAPVTATNVALTAGTHEVVVVFHESGGGESLSVQWTPNGTGTGLQNLIDDVTPPVICPTNPSFGMDFGDAPASYQDAGHVPSASLLIGSIQGDIDDGSQTNDGADEEGTTLNSLNDAATTYSLSVTVNNSSGNTATLYGWIDLDLDGTFDQNERVSTTVTSPTSGTVNLDWTGITPTAGTSYVRLRLTTDPLEDNAEANDQDDVSFGAAADGEVEDYELNIANSTEVFFEAECGVIGNSWTVRSSATAAENTFVKVDAASDFVTLNSAVDEPEDDMIQYQVTIPLAGTYDLYAFANTLDSGNADGMHFSFDNDTWTTINNLNDGDSAFDWLDLEADASNTFQELTTIAANEVVNLFVSYRDTDFEIDRFAFLTDDSAVPTEPTLAVGSCFDFGDAPDGTAGNGVGDYTTDLANTGPYHIVTDIGLTTQDLYLGNVVADTENNALDNATATGDDASDEGEAQLISTADGDAFPTITAADGSISFEIDVTNDKAVSATLMGWIDFDQDGLFEESERADSNPTVTASAGDTQSTLTWTAPTLISGSAVARFRLSTDPEFFTADDGGEDALSTDVVIDGEVEDHQLTILGIDYGDTPVTTNGDYDDTDSDGDVDASDNAARHIVVSGINLGTDPDEDTGMWGNGTDANGNATDDDTPGDPAGGTDDEDGISTFSALSTVYTTYSLSLSVNNGDVANAANVLAWIDFDGSGSFDEDERATITGGVSSGGQIPASTSGSVTLDWATVPSDILSGTTYARVRITTDSGIVAGSDGGEDEAAFGLATDGEVEDYELVITGVDFGDAPSSFGSAQHSFLNTQDFFIGSVLPDGENAAAAGEAANGDDVAGTDDEDADPSFAGLSKDSSGTFNVTVAVTNAGANATLAGWIDFDDSGTFEDDEGATVAANATGNVVLAFDVDTPDIVVGTTHARFRITRQAITIADDIGSFSDGEVEDYSLFIAGTDFGDAPVAYDNTAQHGINGENIQLGSTAPDDDTGFWGDGTDDNLNATDDDTSNDPVGGVDDEGGINTGTLAVLSSGADTYTASVSLRNENTGSTAANVYAWIDFDGSNTFDEDERATLSTGTITPNSEADPTNLSVPSAALTGSVDLDWTGIQAAGISAGTTYLRVRITTDDLDSVANGSAEDDASVGTATDGEIEDYQITVVANIDYGDAPVTTSNEYDDTDGDGDVDSSDDPARHNIVSGILLGSAIDADSLTWGNGTDANGNASDDDTEGSAPDDDDGVTGSISIPVDQSAQYDLTVNSTSAGAAFVIGWIDFDGSGTFDEDERTSTTRGAGTGDVTLSWTSFPGLALGTTYARIRISSTDLASGSGTASGVEDAASTGLAADGEVEDYLVSVTGMDFGDVPVVTNGDYDDTNSDGSVTAADNAAEHAIDVRLYLGDVVADSEAAGQNTNGDATDDETNGTADEGVSQLLTSGSIFPTLLPTDVSYSLAVDVSNSTGTTATLYAWVDFDGDKEFDEDERATASVPNGATSASLNWSNIGGSGPDIANGNTFIRLRLTTNDLDISTQASGVEDDASLGTATDGEVEDYSLAIGNFDFGDAPDLGSGQAQNDYRTLSVDEGPTHTISPTIYLGSTAPDLDSNGFEEGTDDSDVGSGGNATDDDSNGGDEGLAQLLTSGSSFPALASGDASYSLEVDMSNTSGGPVNVIAWIDFDQSGTFDEDEVAVNTLLGALSSTTLNWASIPNDISDGTTYARFRITSNPLTGNNGSGEDERSYGSFSNGEVEDYQIIISGTDFGDAPSTYGTFDSGGGPKHGVDAGLYLGDTAPDGEGDAYGDGNDANGNATDDDTEGTADEGEAQLLDIGTHAGDVFPTYNISDGTYSLTVDAFKTIAGTATVQAWIDWDIDGDFDEDERAQTTFSSTSGAVTATLNWNIGGGGEPDQVVGNTYMRFRITTDTPAAGGSSNAQDPLSLNAYSNGEVEDYAFTIEGDVNISGNIFEDINYGGGNGRNLTAALADGGSNFGATTNVVELWDFDGSTCTALSTSLTGSNPVSTNALGEYSFTGVDSPATYCVRVVTTPLASTRTSTGAGNTEIAIQTFRSQSTDGNGTVAQITTEIGGRYPQDADSAASTFDDTSGDGTATHSWSQVITGASDITDLDFGYNFNTVVNTNDSGQGSLRQFMLNAEELSNTGLAQQARTAGIDVSIFVIPTTDTGYNATGQGEFTIDVSSSLPVISQEPIELNGSTQTGTICPTPRIEISDNATGGDGIQITTGSSVVRGFIINGFESGSGINLNTSGSNELSCNYIGTNAAGADVGNGGNGTGVTISSGTGNTIGGSATVQNLISANTQDGLSLSSNSNTVSTNIIGLAIDGLTTLGNGDSGILINSASNEIGSISAGDANTIAGNGAAGITIAASASNTANAIYINSIFNNGDTGGAASSRTLGIDLGADGETANDGATDSDTGANTLINAPVLGSIVMGGAANTMDIPVTLALPDGTYRVEFYANAVCNALNTGIEDSAATSGEGQDFTGSQSIIITSGVADVTTVNLSTLGVVGSEMTAKVIDNSGNTSEFSDCQTIPTGVVPAATITGTIFEDVNYGGGAGRDYTAANSAYGAANVGTQSTVELWASDGNNCTGGSPLQAVTSNPTNGSYSFNTVNDTLFCVRVVNNTVQSNRTGWNSSLVPVQTYRSAATDPTKAVGGASPRDTDSAAGVYDAITGDGNATQSFSIIDVSGGNVTGVDFGFNFSTVVNANSTGQGSLAQFVANANTLDASDKSGLAQQGLAAGRETSIFMVSNGAELPGLPSSIPNLLSGNSVAEITLSSTLTVTADDIILDGTTQTTNVGGNAATLGTGGNVGTQSLALNTLNGPEVQLEQGSIDIRGNDIEVRGFAMLPTSSAITINNGALTGHVIEQNVIGASAISFSEPGSGSSADLISIASATGNGTSGSPGTLGLIQNNLIGFGSGDGITLSSNATGWTITNNELQGFSGDAAISLGAGVNNTNIRGNLIATSTYGIELNNSSGSNAADSIDENTIQANVSGGIIIPATATSDGGNSITQNIVSTNTGPGVIVLTSQTNLISENSIFNNDGLGIDLGNDGVTNGVESGSAANEFLNVPDVTMADASDGTNLDIDGTYTSTQASTPITIELYSSSTCNPNSSGVAEGTDFGEGESFEGSTTVSGGNFNLSVLLSALGTRRFITAIARDSDGNTSEFSQCEIGLTSDYGDAPNSYFTSEASGGPSHTRDSQIFIGTGVGGDGGVGVPDIESDAAVSADATGDDSTDSDDEDGIDPSTDFSFLTSASDSFALTVDVYNNSGSSAYLVGWIDYDDSGTFDNDEVATVEVTTSAATGRTATLNWSSIPLDVLDGVTFARLRLTTDTSIATGTASTSSPIGPALDGEVEDYQITIAEGRDYGDAPDSYDTLIASGGPSHVRNLQIYMGSVPPDGEFDGVPAAADADPVGDDDNGVQDDEDGVVIPGLIDSDTSLSVSVDVINTTGGSVTLHGWFDQNRDGNFGTGGVVDTGEYTSVTLSGGVGSINDVALTWSSLSQPAVNGADFAYIRVRLTPTSEGLGSGDWGGNFGDGEVEDYRITVAEFNCNSLYVHTAADSVLTGDFNRVQLYNPSGSVGNTLTDVITATGSSAGTALDGITRRYYWNDRNSTDSIVYDDGSGAVDTGFDVTPNANWNRSAFDPDGVLWVLESGIDAGDLAAYSAAGVEDTSIGDTILNDSSNGTNITGTTGGDIAFDLDGNLYILSYNGGATEYYVYRVLADDLRDSNNPTAVQIQQTTGISGQTAGAAFFTSNDLYLFDTDGDVFAWDLNTSTPVQVTDAANGGSNFGVVDAASCIFPTLRPSLIVEKRVFNVTDSGSPGFTPGDTLRYRITVENVGAFFADSTTFIDQIPANSTYIQNSTTLNGISVSDNGGQMPYETATSINSPSGAPGEIESLETATIEFQVLVDNGTTFTQVCNDSSIVEYTNVANALNGQLTIQQATNDPTTPANPTLPAVGGVTDDPTCSDKVSGYAISGTVYEDLNVNAIDDGSGTGEDGISGVEIVLRDNTAGTCQSTSTDISGNYSFGPLDGGNYTVYEANGVATPVPAACPPITADPTDFESSTAQTIAVLVTNANIENQDFGDVRGPNFSPNNTGVVLPTSSVFYSHTFAPNSEGSVIFSFSETTTPLNNGWSVTLYEDTACNGSFDVGDNVISNAITVSLTGNIPDDICILSRVSAPSDVTAGDGQVTTISATFTYGDGSAGIVDEVLNVTDTTTTLSSGDGTMVLAKLVENITVSSDFYDNGVPGTSNDAAPGDELRYTISFQNISTSAISTVDIFDIVPSFTFLSADLPLDCFNDPQNDFASTSITDCQISAPTGVSPVGHPQGYEGDLQWDLTGQLEPGESGSISFTVEVE